MKRIPTIVLWVVIVAFLAPRFPDGFAMSDESPGVFGPVRSVRTEKALFIFKDGRWVEGPRALSLVVEVDNAHRLITSTRILKDGAAADRTVFELDAAGRTVRKTMFSKDGKVSLVMTCEYDRDGRLAVKTVSHPLENRIARIVTTRNPDGTVQSTTGFVNQAAEGVKSLYSYDRAGRESGRTAYGPDGSIAERVFTRYESAGNRTETHQDYFHGSVEATLIFAYDARGNLTFQSFEPGEEERFEYEFDSHGNPTRTTATMCNVTLGIFRQCRPESVAYSTITYYSR